VLVQRPANLDTAYTLTLLQEEVDSARRKDFKRVDYSFKARSSSGDSPLPLPSPPVKMDKSQSNAHTDKKASEQVQSGNQYDSKVAALRAYRRACGLC
jgi:hypothetical protein